MKRFFLFIIMFSFICINVNANKSIPKYKIIANSNSEKDISEMYDIKKQLLVEFKEWSMGVNDVNQVLCDHVQDFDAEYENGTYTIVLGKGNGKELVGDLKVNYCESSSDLTKKSFLFDFLF